MFLLDYSTLMLYMGVTVLNTDGPTLLLLLSVTNALHLPCAVLHHAKKCTILTNTLYAVLVTHKFPKG